MGDTTAATIVLVIKLLVLTAIVKANEDLSISEKLRTRKLQATEEQSKLPIKIGEDCSQSDTACEYFRPTQFFHEQPVLISEVLRAWNLKSMDDFCARTRPWAVEMFGFDCDEEGVPPSSEYCRPKDSENNPILDPKKHPYWFLPMSFTFKHVRKAGGNSFLPAMWGIDENRSPQFKVTKIRASIDGMNETDHMAMERMDSILENQKIGNKNHPFFLSVRNPLSRFVSSVGQVLYDITEVRDACWDRNDRSSTIRCVLEMVENGFNNIHTIPMFADIYCNVKGRDVEVSMYQLKDMAGVLSALGLRNGILENRRKFRLSVSDLDEDMVQRICALYVWDVSMMELVGFDVPECHVKTEGL